MNSFNPDEAYVSPHMLSFVGVESSSCSNSSSSQRQHLWDWEATTHPPTTALHQAASLFSTHAANNNNSNNTSFFGCAGPVLPALGGGGYPFPSAVVGDSYQLAGFVKSEQDPAGAGQGIGLNLGHRTYFPSGDAVAVDQLFRRARGFYQVSQQVPRCQAEGCKADLSGAKHYHRRHKVCELHSKAAMVVAGGMQQRFCQQCSRFHPLSEFDEAKRSCRRRLAEHNRRRRKSQAAPVASTAASDHSTPPDTSTTSTEKSKQGSPRPMRTLAATGDIITTTASTTSPNSQANTSLESPKDYHKTATHLRNGPALSLGGAGGADRGGFGFQYHQQMPWAVMSDENTSSQQQLQEQQRISSSSSSGILFQSQNFFCGSANEATQSTAGDHHQNIPLQLGQGMLEVDFI